MFLSGEYVGYEGVMRLYGTWFQNLFTKGVRGPIHGFLLDHFQLQDVITVGEDGLTAKGRFRGILAAAGMTKWSPPSRMWCLSNSGSRAFTRTTM